MPQPRRNARPDIDLSRLSPEALAQIQAIAQKDQEQAANREALNAELPKINEDIDAIIGRINHAKALASEVGNPDALNIVSDKLREALTAASPRGTRNRQTTARSGGKRYRLDPDVKAQIQEKVLNVLRGADGGMTKSMVISQMDTSFIEPYARAAHDQTGQETQGYINAWVTDALKADGIKTDTSKGRANATYSLA